MVLPSVFQLPAYRRQNLLVEFASLKSVQLQGVYVTLSQGDPTHWSGVLFVRQGPYAPAVLRFRILFPSAYPLSPPSVIFAADVFHPLLTPLTTITYTTGLSERETAHATSHERLPPGSFGLRHGFPQWFEPPAPSAIQPGDGNGSDAPQQHVADVHVVDILRYLRSCFEDPNVLDSVPFDVAGNPGAWYAWRAHRANANAPLKASSAPKAPPSQTDRGTPTKKEGAKSPAHSRANSNPHNRPRRPSEWNWEGVWEERVKKAIKASLTEPALFGGNSSQPDDIHFQSVRDEDLSEIHFDMRQHLSNHD